MVEAMSVEEVADWLKDRGFGDDIREAFKGDFAFLTIIGLFVYRLCRPVYGWGSPRCSIRNSRRARLPQRCVTKVWATYKGL